MGRESLAALTQPSKFHIKAVHPLFEIAGHLEPRMVKHILHPLVFSKDLGGKTGDTVTLGDLDQVLEQICAQAFILPTVADNKGHLGKVALLVEIIGAHCNDLIAMGLGDSANYGHIATMIDIDEILNLTRGEPLLATHEPVIDRFLAEVIDQIPHMRFVGGLDRAETDLGSIGQQERCPHRFLCRGQKTVAESRQVGAEIFGLHRIAEQLFAEFGVGNPTYSPDATAGTKKKVFP